MSAASMCICLIITAFTGRLLNTSDNPTKHNGGCLLICHLKTIIHLIIKHRLYVLYVSHSILIYIPTKITHGLVYNRFIETGSVKLPFFGLLPSFSFKTSVCKRNKLSKSWVTHIYWWMCLSTQRELFLFLCQ